jgi:hypothetical protein
MARTKQTGRKASGMSARTKHVAGTAGSRSSGPRHSQAALSLGAEQFARAEKVLQRYETGTVGARRADMADRQRVIDAARDALEYLQEDDPTLTGGRRSHVGANKERGRPGYADLLPVLLSGKQPTDDFVQRVANEHRRYNRDLAGAGKGSVTLAEYICWMSGRDFLGRDEYDTGLGRGVAGVSCAGGWTTVAEQVRRELAAAPAAAAASVVSAPAAAAAPAIAAPATATRGSGFRSAPGDLCVPRAEYDRYAARRGGPAAAAAAAVVAPRAATLLTTSLEPPGSASLAHTLFPAPFELRALPTAGAGAAAASGAHCPLQLSVSRLHWTCEVAGCPHASGAPRPGGEPHFRCLHDIDVCRDCAFAHSAFASGGTLPLADERPRWYDRSGHETCPSQEAAGLRHTANTKGGACSYDVQTILPCFLPVSCAARAPCSACAACAELTARIAPSAQETTTVVWALHGTWLVDQVALPPSLLPADEIVLQRSQQPRLSVLWAASSVRLTKSLVCSQCGPCARAYWHCRDADCHLALCARCYARVRYPHEQSLNLAFQRHGESHLLAPTCSCRDFVLSSEAPGVAPARCFTMQAGGPADRSLVLRPFALVAFQGLSGGDGAEQAPTAALDFARRCEALVCGFGVFPFFVTFPTKTLTLPKLLQKRDELCAALALTDTRALVLDLRAHRTSSGYLFGALTFSALDVFNQLVLPAIQAFRTAHARFHPGETLPASRVLVVFHCCDMQAETWQAMMADAAQRGCAFELLTFGTALLLADFNAVLPPLLPLWANMLEQRDLPTLLRYTLSGSFIADYQPVVVRADGIVRLAGAAAVVAPSVAATALAPAPSAALSPQPSAAADGSAAAPHSPSVTTETDSDYRSPPLSAAVALAALPTCALTAAPMGVPAPAAAPAPLAEVPPFRPGWPPVAFVPASPPSAPLSVRGLGSYLLTAIHRQAPAIRAALLSASCRHFADALNTIAPPALTGLPPLRHNSSTMNWLRCQFVPAA